MLFLPSFALSKEKQKRAGEFQIITQTGTSSGLCCPSASLLRAVPALAPDPSFPLPEIRPLLVRRDGERHRPDRRAQQEPPRAGDPAEDQQQEGRLVRLPFCARLLPLASAEMRINPRADSPSSVFVRARSYYDRKYRVCQLRSRSGGGVCACVLREVSPGQKLRHDRRDGRASPD